MNILTNKIQCIHCNDIIESFTTHDFVVCSCGKVGIDGGKEYFKRIGSIADYIDMSSYEADSR